MPKARRVFTGAEKVAILREHLVEKVPISDVCDRHRVQPTLFYKWQKKLFEEAASVLERSRRPLSARQAGEARRLDALEHKLQERNEVLAELLGEYVALRKTMAGPDASPFGIGTKAINPSRRSREPGL